jgi:activator of HSP90 ATPase
MSDSIKLSITLPIEPKILYNAWLSSKKHTAFTKSNTEIEKKVGSIFSAGDGYISGKNELLHMNKRIVQSWRTTDFPEDHPDSTLEIIFEKVEKGTKLIIAHSDLPTDTGKTYRKGWRDHYFKPMKEYFENK